MLQWKFKGMKNVSGTVPNLTVELRSPAAEGWHLTLSRCQYAHELLELYSRDLGLGLNFGEFLTTSAKDLIRSDHWLEMESLSRRLAMILQALVLCNLCYDALKVILRRVFGCTGFAVDTPRGVLHSRNLDWWTENSASSGTPRQCI